MLRRPFVEVPMSRLAAWSWRLALFGLVVVLLSIVVVRSGLLEVYPSLAAFGAGLALAALAVLLAFASFVSIWRQGYTGLGRALGGLLLALLLLAYPGYLGYRASKLPAINDITTDMENPPRFDKLAHLRPSDRLAYPKQFAALQEKAYPDIEPLDVDASPRTAFKAALGVVEKRKWQVIDARMPERRRDGVIEAVARTPIMGFRDDVVIRVSAEGNGSRIDVRSASRYGLRDLGTNAARVASLLEDLNDAVSAAPPEPAVAPEPEPQRKPERRKPRRIRR
ncbi:MAG TPA: DUF1499 domain-containing protein [Pseudolabrys sp.]|nr:DUF1499 domain-containing protein [Pseudolabrys sp.]